MYERLLRASALAFTIAFAAAAIGMFFHDIAINPQYDNQGIWYASDGITALYRGTLDDFYFAKRKYPLLYVMPYIPLLLPLPYGGPPTAIFFAIGRFVSFVYGIGTLAMLWLAGKRLHLGKTPMLLAMTSIMLVLFSSAIRPHIAVTFWTLCTYICALRLAERRTTSRAVLAFGAATIAFCTLQSGLLAFIFPVWAWLRTSRSRRDALLLGSILCVCAGVSAVLGYPFLFAPGTEVSADLGHDVGLRFGVAHLPALLAHLLGNSPLLFLLAALGVARWIRGPREPWDVRLTPVVVYIALFTSIFTLHTSTVGRFFLPVLLLLPLLTARTFVSLPRPLAAAFLLAMTVVHGNIARLSLKPNTYQRTWEFLDQREGFVATVGQPYYFFGLEQARIATTPEEVERTQTLVIPDYDGRTGNPETWSYCFRVESSHWTKEIVLLWNDTPWAFVHALEARALGPNLSVYCRKEGA